MINTLEAYEDAGRRCARSRNNGDAGTAHYHQTWMLDAQQREAKADQAPARAAYDKGYHEERKP